MEGTDSATMETVTFQHETDRYGDAGGLQRQETRREMRGERIPLTKA